MELSCRQPRPWPGKLTLSSFPFPTDPSALRSSQPAPLLSLPAKCCSCSCLVTRSLAFSEHLVTGAHFRSSFALMPSTAGILCYWQQEHECLHLIRSQPQLQMTIFMSYSPGASPGSSNNSNQGSGMEEHMCLQWHEAYYGSKTLCNC